MMEEKIHVEHQAPKLRIVEGAETKEYLLTETVRFGRRSKNFSGGIEVASGVVSRYHGDFTVDQERGTVSYLDAGSTNGTWYNGRMLAEGERCVLSDGDVLRVHGSEDPEGTMDVVLLFETGEQEMLPADDPKDVLSIWIEERSVINRGKKKTLLKDIHMDIPVGSMVLVLGGSGAGKTTFMNAVMGYEQADGQILYRGTDIYSEYEKMKYEIAYVPQQDLLRMNDTVMATLENAAAMHLPKGMAPEEVRARIEKTVLLLGLDRVRDSLVGKLSGGQRKRLSIAVEYIGNPALFFLDEPDSGLDGVMARSLMENLRTIADDGKIVMVISHAPDRAFELFDAVIVLAKSSRDDTGHLVFFGSPTEALAFFGAKNLEEVVRRINRVDEGGDGKADDYLEKYAALHR